MRVGAIAAFFLALSPDTAWAWAWPADGPLLRGFSVQDDRYAAGQHRGIDVALGGASVVRTPASGEVSFAGQVPTHGLTVTIVTSGGYKASLTHLGVLRVRAGESVGEGDPIADAGPSGDAEHDTPYVHLGIRVGDDDTYVDPLGLLPSRGASNPPPAPAAPPATLPPSSATPPPPVAAQPAPTACAGSRAHTGSCAGSRACSDAGARPGPTGGPGRRRHRGRFARSGRPRAGGPSAPSACAGRGGRARSAASSSRRPRVERGVGVVRARH
jgi:hypothetical protein